MITYTLVGGVCDNDTVHDTDLLPDHIAVQYEPGVYHTYHRDMCRSVAFGVDGNYHFGHKLSKEEVQEVGHCIRWNDFLLPVFIKDINEV